MCNIACAHAGRRQKLKERNLNPLRGATLARTHVQRPASKQVCSHRRTYKHTHRHNVTTSMETCTYTHMHKRAHTRACNSRTNARVHSEVDTSPLRRAVHNIVTHACLGLCAYTCSNMYSHSHIFRHIFGVCDIPLDRSCQGNQKPKQVRAGLCLNRFFLTQEAPGRALAAPPSFAPETALAGLLAAVCLCLCPAPFAELSEAWRHSPAIIACASRE